MLWSVVQGYQGSIVVYLPYTTIITINQMQQDLKFESLEICVLDTL